ncbi:hypothetical protein [Saccharopolyspora taberi]|uniref:Uncharacterized protein n=1 Tax=Saccharopolyspora taberi TaxID=60895 RepID=A0ABN3VA68_9PSEU
MIIDPTTAWSGPFPYDVLAPAGITPESAHSEVEDASFTLMARGLMNQAAHKAWNQLRDPRTRLLADLLVYDVDPGAEIGRARERIRRELAGLALEASEPASIPPEIGAFPARALIDSLVEFDR